MSLLLTINLTPAADSIKDVELRWREKSEDEPFTFYETYAGKRVLQYRIQGQNALNQSDWSDWVDVPVG